MVPDAHEQDGRSAAAAEAPGAEEDAAQWRCAYFYYIPSGTIGDDGHFHGDVQAFVMQEANFTAGKTIEELIVDWTEQARSGQVTPVGWALGDLRWRRKSYFIVVLGAPGFEFTSERALIIKNESASFSHKTLLSFTAADGTEMQAIHCRNRMQKKKKENGEEDDWGPHPGYENSDFYELQLNPTPHGGHMAPQPKGRLDHDDVGTNTGPPVGGGGLA